MHKGEVKSDKTQGEKDETPEIVTFFLGGGNARWHAASKRVWNASTDCADSSAS